MPDYNYEELCVIEHILEVDIVEALQKQCGVTGREMFDLYLKTKKIIEKINNPKE